MAHTDTVRVSATEFKQSCLSLLDHVAETGEEIIVTKHGKPVARVVPIDAGSPGSLLGSVTVLTDNPEDLYSTGEVWEADQP